MEGFLLGAVGLGIAVIVWGMILGAAGHLLWELFKKLHSREHTS